MAVGTSVMVIDDNDLWRSTIRGVLSVNGYEVVATSCSKEAEAYLGNLENRPVLAIIDGLDGEGERLAEFCKKLGILTVGFSDNPVSFGDENLQKGKSTEKLLEAVERLLKGVKQQIH